MDEGGLLPRLSLVRAGDMIQFDPSVLSSEGAPPYYEEKNGGCVMASRSHES